MQRKILLLALMFTSLPLLTQANIRPIASLTLGYDNVNLGKTQSVTLLPPFQTTYVTSQHADNEFFGGGFIGAEAPISKSLDLQLGLGYYQTKVLGVQGTAFPLYPDNFNLSNYQYNIQNHRYLLESKLLYNMKKIHPYVMAGVGKSVNKSYGYQEQSLSSFGTPLLQPYSAHTSYSLTYDVGAGVDVDVTRRVRLGAGYRFADLGRATLGAAPNQGSTDELNYNHLYTNEVFVQLSSFIG